MAHQQLTIEELAALAGVPAAEAREWAQSVARWVQRGYPVRDAIARHAAAGDRLTFWSGHLDPREIQRSLQQNPRPPSSQDCSDHLQNHAADVVAARVAAELVPSADRYLEGVIDPLSEGKQNPSDRDQRNCVVGNLQGRCDGDDQQAGADNEKCFVPAVDDQTAQHLGHDSSPVRFTFGKDNGEKVTQAIAAAFLGKGAPVLIIGADVVELPISSAEAE